VAAEGIAGLPEQNVSSKSKNTPLIIRATIVSKNKKFKNIQKRPMIERQF
jgi:hypothetical protein